MKTLNKIIFLRWTLMALILLLPLISRADDIQVIKQHGHKAATKSGSTKLVINTPDSQIIPIYKVLGQSSVFVAGSGGSAGGFGLDLKQICDAPAELKLDNGFYNLHVGGNAMLGCTFRVDAEGGTQIWQVKNYDTGEFLGGVSLFSVSTGALILGSVFYAVGDTDDYGNTTHDATWLVVGILGLAGAVGGFAMLDDSGAKAQLLSVKF